MFNFLKIQKANTDDCKVMRFVDDKNHEKLIAVYQHWTRKGYTTNHFALKRSYYTKNCYDFVGILGISESNQKLCLYDIDKKIRLEHILAKNGSYNRDEYRDRKSFSGSVEYHTNEYMFSIATNVSDISDKDSYNFLDSFKLPDGTQYCSKAGVWSLDRDDCFMTYGEIKKYLPDYISKDYLFSISPFMKKQYEEKIKEKNYWDSIPNISKDDFETFKI